MPGGTNYVLQFVIETKNPFDWYKIIPDIMKECKIQLKTDKEGMPSTIVKISKEYCFWTDITEKNRPKLYEAFEEYIKGYSSDPVHLGTGVGDRGALISSRGREEVKHTYPWCDFSKTKKHTSLELYKAIHKIEKIAEEISESGDGDDASGIFVLDESQKKAIEMFDNFVSGKRHIEVVKNTKKIEGSLRLFFDKSLDEAHKNIEDDDDDDDDYELYVNQNKIIFCGWKYFEYSF